VASEPTELLLGDVGAWADWLAQHGEDHDGTWLVLAKKGTSTPTSLSYDEALEEALCHGWIDGQVRRRDAGTYRQRFTPRRPRSIWSKRNVGLVARLESEGRMRPAGERAVAAAKADGRWQAAYDGAASIAVPAELADALAAEPRAAAMFEILTAQNRYAILHRVTTARRAETRAARVERLVAMLARGETPYPQRRRLSDG
jgi:uncharacterized protein YdeI (YjbR/CyaY-like superfamily)